MYLLLSALLKWSFRIHTTHLSHRLVSLAVRRVMLAGAISGGACRVWIFLDGWLGGLVPTILTCLIRNLKPNATLWHSLQRLFMIISHHVTVGGPVVGVGVQSLNFKRSRVRLIGQLMDRYPLLIFSNNADLKEPREQKHQRRLMKTDRECDALREILDVSHFWSTWASTSQREMDVLPS